MATAAPITTYSDREFLFRLQTLVIDGGTQVLRNIFDQRLQNQPLNVVLASEQSTVNRLRRQKIITTVQYNSLYPSCGQLPTSMDLDITLIVCLLRNLPCLGCNQNYNWNVPPQTGDTSVEADVCRLRVFRNEIAHISSTTGFQQSSFQAKWREIETVLLRLDQNSPSPNFSQTIDSYKYGPMDPANEQKIRTMIEQWQERDRGLETDMQLIKKDFSDTKEDVKSIKKDLSDTKEDVKTIKKDFSDTQEDVKSIKKDFSNTKEDVKTIKKDFSGTKEDVKSIKKDFSDTQEDVKTIKKDFSDTKEDVKTIKKDFSATQEDVKTIKKDVIYLRQALPCREETETEKAYDEMKSNLQDDLISFYKDQHKSIPLSPLMEEDQPLLKFYEMPDILSVRLTRSQGWYRSERTPVNRLQDVFYKENKLYSNIYLTADAGYGKTALSKKLALAWCQAKKPDKSEEKRFSKHELTVMGGFRFVFVVLLRDSSSECDIEKLILNQICSQLAHKHKYNEENVADIMCQEQCLVILDGLDEWTHPENSCRRRERNIPHRAVRENVAVLTTTRPWKLSVCDLHSSQIDQQLELKGLRDDSAKKLKRSVISHLHGELDESKIDEYETDFNRTVQENHKSDITAIPLFLIYFLFLWFHKMNVGKSLADLCSSFIELLLFRTVKKETKTETVQGNIPPCFNNNTLCKQFYTLLTTLGKLAFYTLFSETKENTLVFDGCIAEKYLSKDELTFCLKTGIITQSKVQGATLLQQKTKVSFAHKTMQEFLAALYIHSATDQKSVQEIVLSKCKRVKDILDMSKMFMFIVSISGEFSLSRELMKVINEDEITQEYRRSLQSGFSHPLKDIQDMYISCCKEIPRENEVNVFLQDVFIEWSYKQEEYRENLKRLTTRNKQNIRSVCIDMRYMKGTLYDTGRKVIDYFALSDLENIEKIHYNSGAWDEDIDDVISPLLNSSVTSLYLWCDGRSWSRSLFDKVTGLQKLEAIGIGGLIMSTKGFYPPPLPTTSRSGDEKRLKEERRLSKPLPSEASGSEYGKQTKADQETSYSKYKSTEHGWRECLQMTDKASQLQIARKLLELNILPDQAQVRLASSVFGRCSETFLYICSSISEHIKSKSNDFIDVWAAYRYCKHIKDDDIEPVFVVITKKGKTGVSENNFDVIKRDEAVFSPESEKVLLEVENDLSSVNSSLDSKLTDIEKCVALNADSLMDKHRNLNIVSPSVKKSKNFGETDAQISDELCIALHVHIKGLIPIAEEPFPSNIGEFRTDVLEGGFKLFHGPKDYHEQLKMGLAIHTNEVDNNGEPLCGTLGGFLDYQHDQHVFMCALTCAHVVLTTHEMQKLVTCNQLSSIDKEVFQSGHPFGKGILAVYRTGEQSSGIDAALIKIIQRHPQDGSFPESSNYADAGFDERKPMVYKKGKVSPVDGIRPRTEVYKYGISTEVTRGSLGLCGSIVKTSEMSANNQQFEYRLHNQIQVLRIDGACFASPGDSGALVFFDDDEKDSVAIGIVEGGHTNGRIVYVTPICAILDNFGTDFSMTKFINYGSVSNDSGQEMDTS